MRKRRERGLVIMLIIISVCLFLMTMPGGFLSSEKRTEKLEPQAGNKTNTEESAVNQEAWNKDMPMSSNLLDKDIAVTDSLGMTEEEKSGESASEQAFLRNNLFFERSGSQMLIGAAAAILIIYLVLVGPITYFYLKRIRKMERMWFLIPGLSIGFGCIILLMSNDFVIREPYADVIKVITPGEKTVCYGVATSPGEDSYSLYFDDKVKSLQPWETSRNYVINEEKRSLTLYPDSAFEKDYFQFFVTEMPASDFIYNIKIEDKAGVGILYNTTGYSFTHLMLCYEDNYCILPALNPGDSVEVTEELWKKEEYGVSGNLKEELQMHPGLNGDEETVLNLAWQWHINEAPGELHIAAVSKEGDVGLKEKGVDLISYSLFYR